MKADRDLAAVLRRDLQLNLRRQVGTGWNLVWTDPTDSRLPEIPEEASWGVVVVSPEALADQQLMNLWHSALCQGNRSGRRRLVAVSVAPSVPWPEWLEDRFERVDLAVDTYRIDLAAIISKWIGTTEKKISADALEVEGPGLATTRLSAETYGALTDWLAPAMQRKTTRQLLATTLGLGLQTALDDFETSLLRASAAIVRNRGDDDPTAGALRLIDLVLQTLDEDESMERLEALRAIADQLHKARVDTPTDLGLLPTWLRKVRRDHERLVDYFQQRQELDLLDRVYVELAMLPDARNPEPKRRLWSPPGPSAIGASPGSSARSSSCRSTPSAASIFWPPGSAGPMAGATNRKLPMLCSSSKPPGSTSWRATRSTSR